MGRLDQLLILILTLQILESDRYINVCNYNILTKTLSFLGDIMQSTEQITITINKKVLEAMRKKKLNTGLGVSTQISIAMRVVMNEDNYL